MKVLPLFTSAYSFRSILTLDKPPVKDEDKADYEGGPDSIVKIAKDEGLEEVFLVEENMVGLLEAKKNLGKGIQLRFGVRFTFCADIEQRTPESEKTECKYIIFACNPEGYARLTEIFTKANVDGHYEGRPRLDFKSLKEFWNEEDLVLAVPFYDSFVHRNTCYLSKCIPDFSFTNPVFFVENNGLYFDSMLAEAIEEFDSEKKYDRERVQTIYYKDRKDFLAWQTYKCIGNDSTLRVPNLENCMSDNFSVEGWKEANV